MGYVLVLTSTEDIASLFTDIAVFSLLNLLEIVMFEFPNVWNVKLFFLFPKLRDTEPSTEVLHSLVVLNGSRLIVIVAMSIYSYQCINKFP
jgi:hypothetical protein